VFFFHAADSIRDFHVTGVQTCALPIFDDLIVYFLAEDFFRLVVNAATRDKDLAWITAQAAPYGVSVTEREDFAMIAAQGPNARRSDERRVGKDTKAQRTTSHRTTSLRA